MTISESSAITPRTSVIPPDIPGFDDAVFCSLCGQRLTQDAVGTPSIPTAILDDPLPHDEIPVFGYRCDQHRTEDVVVPVPASLAPDSFVRVDATVDGHDMTVAVPAPEVDDE